MIAALAVPSSASQQITINSTYSPPYTTPNRDGYFDLLLIEAFGRLGYQVHVNMLPAQRALADAASGRADGDIGRIAGLEKSYPSLVRVPEPALDSREFVGFSRHVDIATTSWETLAPYHLAYVEGWQIFRDNVPKQAIVTALHSTDALFRFLDKDRCDIALTARFDGLAMLKALHIEDVHILEPPLASLKMYLYLNRNRIDLVEPLAEIFREMKADGSIDSIRTQVFGRYARR
ncbi:substrate-binding periplasmic protein [Oceanidesulfovibrio marinus]|uniref:Solute-binding protein family 3/N-terminal domain-containing protein n=1 Tax=Oceanidesulfovibrio marinus TaxID=370038 RepID=A0A6P1ZIC2_9BACT|nr:hypothetical protein [Oceanidesulfovibrio marinus]TVM32749.1 hypothetical protein DQK91_13640 [Oceanidesulfovibrio marinus]